MDPRRPLISLPIETRKEAVGASWFLPAFDASEHAGLAVFCARPVHHVLEFSQLFRVLEEARRRGPHLSVHVWLRSALRDWEVLRTLPATRVEQLPDAKNQPAWAELTARLRKDNWISVGLDLPSVVPWVGVRPITVLNGGRFSFEASAAESVASADASRRFHDALSREAPRWLGGPFPVADPAPPRRILVHQSRFRVGNALWLTPLLRSIADRFPSSRITVAGSGAAAKALQHNRFVAEFLEYSPERGESERRRLLAELRGRSFGAAILALARRPKSRWLAEAAAEMEIPVRVNLEYFDAASDGVEASELFTHEGWFFWSVIPSAEFLLHGLTPFLPPEPAARRRLLQDRSADFPVEPVWRHQAAGLLAENGIGDEPFVVLSPGGHSSDRWPPSSFAAIAIELGARFGWHSIVNAGQGEESILEEVMAAVERGRDPAATYRVAAAQTSLGVLAALIEGAIVLVGNDSAPIHLAEAVNTPALYFAHREKLVHSHPDRASHWALYDSSANQPGNISHEDAIDALLKMIAAGHVRLKPLEY